MYNLITIKFYTKPYSIFLQRNGTYFLNNPLISMTNTASSPASFKRSKNCQSLNFQLLLDVRKPLISTLTNWKNYQAPLGA